MSQLPSICLTFDLEEFDLPLEYGQTISMDQQIDISTEGMDALLPIINKYKASCTFFTTAKYAQHNPSLIKTLAKTHEIASHSFYHSSFSADDLQKSKQQLEKIAGTDVIGFRMPRMAPVNYADLKTAGYLYDSSLNPTCIPGRYNHFSKSKTIFKQDDLLIFPASVTPTIRIPLFWLTFKNSNIKWYCRQVQACLNKYGYVNIYLHPWEFADVSAFTFPSYVSKNKTLMLSKLDYFFNHFKNKAQFASVKGFLQNSNKL